MENIDKGIITAAGLLGCDIEHLNDEAEIMNEVIEKFHKEEKSKSSSLGEQDMKQKQEHYRA